MPYLCTDFYIVIIINPLIFDFYEETFSFNVRALHIIQPG